MMHAVDSRPAPAQAPQATPPKPVKRVRSRGQRDSGVAWLLSLPTLLILVAMLGYPLYRMIVLSFQNMRLRELFSGATPPWAGVDQYTKALTDSVFWGVVARTAGFTVVSVTLSVLAGLGIALLMRRVTRGVRMFMMIAMMFVWALPQLVAAQAFRWLTDSDFGVLNYVLTQLGLDYDTHSWFVNPWEGWAVITALVVWAGIPFLAISLSAGLTQVPKELLEAATVDGANPWQSLRNITLPILKPLLMIVTTLSVIWNFGLFTQNWALRDGHPEPVYQTLATYSYTQAFGRSIYSYGSAISVITVLLMLGVMVFYIRQMFKIGEVD
ncbi:N,N'-diacetylchitobiose transport system permease protein [Actinoplanes campanulatus]|uniref:N,N'-diacetylchitobiose transport system permease protein n=1 Tax=Actinoplanes campanulatus TaxID=113559 RepID=A0A7W5FCY0_9ACTN|nr:sugar ABC transporter permease [Actinoplanes campanulatus]MBB3093730.1 N,N'-diacetylchitobiose transport system permease protein [Actinoplanes campanulatus]GGN05275.1 sugar ABC transporter permease [Actinoplanes campanulatus]GID35192.1 sugar ABC transporter permease [Actinoplanes campanulatus]